MKILTKARYSAEITAAWEAGNRHGEDDGFAAGYDKGYSDGKARALVADESYAAGRSEGLQAGEGLLGEVLRAAYSDPLRVRYAYEKARDPQDPSKVSYTTFLKICGETAAMTEGLIREQLAEMGVTL